MQINWIFKKSTKLNDCLILEMFILKQKSTSQECPKYTKERLKTLSKQKEGSWKHENLIKS